MTDIKPTITLLCKHINLLLNTNIKPEMFRLAKYNRSDDNVVEKFWNLLSIMIDSEQPTKVVKKVKHCFLYKLKYKSVQFYALPEDMSYGSRELLIAFSYLLSVDYLNKYIEDAINNSPFNPHAPLETEQVEYQINDYSFNSKQLKTEEDFVNAIEWIKGQISYNKKTTLDYQSNFQKLSSKICSLTSPGSKKESLTLWETLALNNADKAKDFLEKTEKVAKIMQNQELWLHKQAMFWDWMNSVLRERRVNVHLTHSEELEKFVNKLKI